MKRFGRLISCLLLLQCWGPWLCAQEEEPMRPNPEYLFWHTAESPLSPGQKPVFNPGNRHIVIGLSITGTGYYGDMNYAAGGVLNTEFITFQPGLNLTLRREGPRFVLPELNLGYGKFVVQNPDLQPVPYAINDRDTLISPNRYAESVLIYGEFGLHINLVPTPSKIKPFVGVGIGAQAFYPRAEDGILLFRKRSTRAPEEATYGSLAIYFPLSIGTDFAIGNTTSLHLAYSLRFNTTDYLDNIGILGGHQGNDQLHVLRFGVNFLLPVGRTSSPYLE